MPKWELELRHKDYHSWVIGQSEGIHLIVRYNLFDKNIYTHKTLFKPYGAC